MSRNAAAAAIIKAALAAASESEGQKGNKTSEIRGGHCGGKVKRHAQVPNRTSAMSLVLP